MLKAWKKINAHTPTMCLIQNIGSCWLFVYNKMKASLVFKGSLKISAKRPYTLHAENEDYTPLPKEWWREEKQLILDQRLSGLFPCHFY